MKIHLLTIMLILFIFLIGCSSIPFELQSRETNKSIKLEDDKYDSLFSQIEDVEIIVSGEKSNDEFRFFVYVRNSSDNTIFLNDSNFTLYEGNIESNSWKKTTVYTAREYYSKIKRYAGYSTDRHTNSFYDYQSGISGTVTTTIKTYNPYEAQSILSSYEKILFFPVKLPPFNYYSGMVYTDSTRGPDFKLCFEVEGKEHQFYFYRNDREEIVKPFKDKNRTRHSVFYSYTPVRPIGINYSMNNPKNKSYGLGWYLGSSYYIPNFQGYDNALDFYEVDRNGNPTDDSYELLGDTTHLDIEFSLGVNYKLFPYTWVNLGLGVSYIRDYYLANEYWWDGDYRDTEWLRSEDFTIGINPKIGIDLIAGPILVTSKFIFDRLENPTFEIGGGYTY